MKKSKKVKVSRIVTLVAILLTIILIWFGSKKDGSAIEVTTEKAQLRTIVETIPAGGKIKPVIEVKISPDVSGEIVELRCREGDIVKKGDLVIKIKQDIYISLCERAEASLNSVKAQLLQQEANLLQVELNWKRNRTLFEGGAISAAEYETLTTEYEIAKAQVEAAKYNVKSAEAALKEAEENLSKTTIYAPISGRVSKVGVEIGERVVGTSQMAGTEMLRIADFTNMEVVVDVNENDIVRLNIGDSATISVDAYPNEIFSGVVSQIANSAKNLESSLEQTTNFEVRVNLLPSSYRQLQSDSGSPFKPGMSATLSIISAKKESVVAVPLQAITTRSELLSDSVKLSLQRGEVRQHIFVVDSTGSAYAKEIKSGTQDLNYIEVIDGLNEGERIVVAPYSAISKRLKSGVKVKESAQKKGK